MVTSQEYRNSLIWQSVRLNAQNGTTEKEGPKKHTKRQYRLVFYYLHQNATPFSVFQHNYILFCVCLPFCHILEMYTEQRRKINLRFQ